MWLNFFLLFQSSPSSSPVSFYHGGYSDSPANGDLGFNPGADYHHSTSSAISELANAYNFAQNEYEPWQGPPQDGASAAAAAAAAHHPINILSSGWLPNISMQRP